MPAPKTLLELANAPRFFTDWNKAALLLIDHQMEYVNGGLPLVGIDDAVSECRRLLSMAREASAPIFHIVHYGHPASSLFNPSSPYVDIIPELAPHDGEQVLQKALPNAFANTPLDELLAKTGRNQLVIAGFATHMCISATTRSALDHGYAATVVAAACATRDLPSPLGGVIAAADIHAASLAALSDRFANVIPSVAGLAR